MLFLILAILSSASMALVLKCFRNQTGNRYGILLGNYLTCIVISFLMLPEKRLVLHGSGVTLLCGIIGGVFFVAALVCMQSSIRKNGATLTSAFARLGLIVTLIVSFVLFHDRPAPLQYVGIGFALAALAVLRTGSGFTAGKKRAALGFGLLLLTLLASGGADVMAKVFAQYGSAAEDSLYFFYLFSTAALICVVLSLFEAKHHKKHIVLKEFASGILVGLPNFYSSYLLLLALEALPAFLAYPIYSTGTILLVMLVSALLFRERLTKKQLPGILLIFAAIVLLTV